MRYRLAVTAACLLALTACGGSDEPDDKPPAKPSVTAPALSKAEVTEQCVNAVAKVMSDTGSSELDEDAVPKECKALSDSEYLDAYMDGLAQSNQAGRDELQQDIEEAEQP